VGGLLLGGRGRLTSAAQRRMAIELIVEANAAGARLVSACCELGISLRTVKRWRRAFGGDRDGESCSPAINRSTPRCRRGRSCQRWPIKASTSAPSPVFTGSCTRPGSANGEVGHVHRSNRGQYRASGLTVRTRCGAGTSLTCPPLFAVCGFTSTW
jgi:hypothetical protein